MGGSIPGFLNESPSKQELFLFSRKSRMISREINAFCKGNRSEQGDLLLKLKNKLKGVRSKVSQELTSKGTGPELVKKKLEKSDGITNRLRVNRLRPGKGAGFRTPSRVTSKIGRPLAAKARPLLSLPQRQYDMVIISSMLAACSSQFPPPDGTLEISSKAPTESAAVIIKRNLVKEINRKLSKAGSRLHRDSVGARLQ